MIKKIDINIEEMIYTYPTINKEGFTSEEIGKLLTWFPTISRTKFDNAMMGNTCMMDSEGRIINYHCDVLKALRCGFENRELRLEEWD